MGKFQGSQVKKKKPLTFILHNIKQKLGKIISYHLFFPSSFACLFVNLFLGDHNSVKLKVIQKLVSSNWQ